MNIGSIFLNAVGLRSAGSKHNNITYGGVYYPAHTKNGNLVSARFEAIMFLNRRGYTDAAGVAHEGKSETIRIVAWNGKDSKPGKGLADTMAKCISVGKEISCGLDINTYDKRVFVNNQPIADAGGNAITVPAVNFKIDGNVIFGPDSEATVAAEIAAFAGQANFCSRPQFWNVTGHVDHAQWKLIIAQRMAAVCDPTKGSYGYARIVIPEGAVLVDPSKAPTVQTVAATEPTQAAAQIVTEEPVQAAAATNSFSL